APVSGLGFHDNSVDFRIDPGPGVDAPPVIAWSPDLGMITFENRARTVASESTSTIGDNFFRTGGGWSIRAEGTVALGRKTRVESVALPDPNLYAARALVASLARRGVAVEGGAVGTPDSLAYRTVRCCASPLLDVRGRPLPDIIFPILNSSQNWFAEMLLKILGRELKGEGSWSAGLGVEREPTLDAQPRRPRAFALQLPAQDLEQHLGEPVLARVENREDDVGERPAPEVDERRGTAAYRPIGERDRK